MDKGDIDAAIRLFHEAAGHGSLIAQANLVEALMRRDLPEDRAQAIVALQTLLEMLRAEKLDVKAIIASYDIELGDLLREAGRHEEAAQRYDEALTIAQFLPTALPAETLAFALQNRGVSLESLARYGDAMRSYTAAQVVQLPPSVEETRRQAKLTLNIGVVSWKLGLHEEAEDQLRSAIGQLETIGDLPALASSLTNLGLVLAWKNQFSDATIALTRSMLIRKEVFSQNSGEYVKAANNLAVVLTLSDKYDEADDVISHVMTIAQEVGSESALLAQVTDTAAELELRRGDRTGALVGSLKAIDIWRRAPELNGDDLRQAYERISKILKADGLTKASIVFAKLGVNSHQHIKKSNQILDENLSRRLAASYSGLYQDLIDTLLGQGAFGEARFVADLEKQREFEHFFDSQFVPSATPNFGLMLSADEMALEVTMLNKSNLGINPLSTAQAYEGVGKSFPVSGNIPDQLVALAREQSVAALQIIASKDTLHLFLAGPDGSTVHRSIPADRRHLAKMVFEASDATEKGGANAVWLLQQLYRQLISPIEVDLRMTGADTLVISVGGFMRYVPFAALYSGRHFLVEDYAIAYRTSVFKLKPATALAATARSVGFGMTRAAGDFQPLIGAGREIETLFGSVDQAGVLDGSSFLDVAFTADALATALASRPRYVHIASHFRFRPDAPTQSFLLLGDGTGLTLEAMRDRRYRFDGVDLVVLSACETARDTGEGAEVESFGIAAQANGAASVVATLWPISDDATVEFMRQFYRGLTRDSLDKAKALQSAQIAMLDRLPDGYGGKRGAAAFINGMDHTSAGDMVHPRYWAPFVLMGDWR